MNIEYKVTEIFWIHLRIALVLFFVYKYLYNSGMNPIFLSAISLIRYCEFLLPQFGLRNALS